MESLLSVGEVAKLCVVSPSTVQYWERKGYLPSIKTVGRHRRFKRADIIRFLNSQGRRITPEFKLERRKENRVSLDFIARLELENRDSEDRFICNGRLLDISKKGCAVVIEGFNFEPPTVQNLFNHYQFGKIWTKEEVGFIKSPINGKLSQVKMEGPKIRIGFTYVE